MSDWPDHEAIITQFRDWLTVAQQEADQLASTGNGQAAEAPQISLYQLTEEFTALRQEVKLQTKSSRGMQEQADQVLQAFSQAIVHLNSLEPKEQQAARSAARPLVEAIAELDDALERGLGEIQRLRRRVLEDAATQFERDLGQAEASQSWWRRKTVAPYHATTMRLWRSHMDSLVRPAFDSLVEGYRLIQSRLQRAMVKEKIERIDCVGQPVDPHSMTVIEVVESATSRPGTVVDEVRRGYRWQGQVLRFAEVRAVK